MENLLKKVKDFEEVLVGQTSKYKYVEDKLKKLGFDGVNKYIPYKNNSDEGMEYKEDNNEVESTKREFKDSIEDFATETCMNEKEDEIFVDGFNLREAMIAKEILDKPLCKRRRREFRGGR